MIEGLFLQWGLLEAPTTLRPSHVAELVLRGCGGDVDLVAEHHEGPSSPLFSGLLLRNLM